MSQKGLAGKIELSFEDECQELIRLIGKGGLYFRPPITEMPTEVSERVIRYNLLSTYYGTAAQYSTVILPLSHEYHDYIVAAMTNTLPGEQRLPKVDPLKDRGLKKILEDMALLERDMELVPVELQDKGRQALNYARLLISLADVDMQKESI